jgi:hypothetical protein
MTNSQNIMMSPFYIVTRGNCTFVTKARNIQAAGGKMMIIVNSYEQ